MRLGPQAEAISLSGMTTNHGFQTVFCLSITPVTQPNLPHFLTGLDASAGHPPP